MINAKNKTMAITVVMILMLATSVVMISIPNVEGLTSVTLSAYIPYIIGVNSPVKMHWRPSPNMLLAAPYLGVASIWANAIVTFTRPDGSKDVVNGPFKQDTSDIQGHAPAVTMIYTPNMAGRWNMSFSWPGDSTYAAVTRNDSFTVGAHYPRRETWCFLSFRPYPAVGLGQDLLINAWVSPQPESNWDYYENYMFTFTSPTGSSFTVGPMNSELTGSIWFSLPLTELGNWTVKMDFPGDWIGNPATVTRTITVQSEWTVTYQDTPLPTSEWRFPINVENRLWRSIAGPWYQSNYNHSGGAWNPYTEGPRTAHILWKLPSYGQIGGFIGSPHSIETGGGEEAYGAGDAGMYTTSNYAISCIMAGRGYSTSGGNITCFDIRTGEILWQRAGATFSTGVRRGRTAALYNFGANFTVYDAITGAVILNVTGLSVGWYDDPYAFSVSGGRLIKWDTTSTSTNFTTRIIWNVTNVLPQSSQGAHSQLQSGNIVARYFAPGTAIVEYITGVSEETGATAFNTTVVDYSDPETWVYREGPASGSGYGLFYFAQLVTENDLLGYAAYSATTGQRVWISEKTDYPWGQFWAYLPQACAYGTIYGMAYDGVYAFNVTNGKIEWHYIAKDYYTETPYASSIDQKTGEPYGYGAYAFGSTGPVIGGGIVYAPNTEHSPTFIYRGQQLHAIDAFTGEKVWSILGLYSPSAIAEGVLTASDSYNGYTYAFSKGSTATTVSVQNDVYAKGSSVLLKGTVLDMSPAQVGTAAVSDASQTAWMEYLHMQQPFPLNATGVEVSIDALDPNNNFVHLGTATSDTTGKYSLGWEPEIEGKYTIVASFMGSEAYYSSEAETAVLVTKAPAAQPEQTQVQAAPDYTWTLVGIGIALIVTVVLAVAVATMLIVRKRP